MYLEYTATLNSPLTLVASRLSSFLTSLSLRNSVAHYIAVICTIVQCSTMQFITLEYIAVMYNAANNISMM